jgi:uncharacterized LabA/DUF88 family protein
MTNPNAHRLALFIDFENLVTNTGISPSAFDLQPSLDRLLERGKVIFRRAYADWSRFREAKAGLHALGVELVDVPPSTSAGKNAADMRLVIDALELNYARQHIDTFVIASGDSDFVPLANKLRENDRTVIGIAIKDSTSPYFVRACDEFLYLPVSGGRGGRGGGQERDKDKPGPQKGRGGSPSERGSGGKDKKAAAVVPGFARDVVKSLLSRATGPLNPSLIKETIVRKEPDFDERDHGFSTFSRLLEALEKEGLLKLQQLKGRQWYVLPADGGPAPAAPDPDEDVEEEESIPDPEN